MKLSLVKHIRIRQGYEPLSFGGATVLIDGDDTTTYVTIRVAQCNPKDVFSKRLGRETAVTSPEEVVPLRLLPGVLGSIEREAYRRSHVKAFVKTNFDPVIRIFLPKA